jgi:hypothetical protein
MAPWRIGFVVLLLGCVACGIKAPPRPPIDESPSSSPAVFDAPDAGCCAEVKKPQENQ